MLLRYLVENYLKQAATDSFRGELLKGVSDALSGKTEPGDEQTPEAAAPREPEGGPIPCDIVAFFALGMEAVGLTDKLENSVTNRLPGVVEHAGELAGKRIVVVETGVGKAAAEKIARETLAYYQPQWVVSAGFAGGLAEGIARGEFVVADASANLSGASLAIGLSMASQKGVHVGKLLTVDRIIRKSAEKLALGKEHQAVACDMETFAIAAVCRDRGLRFLSMRVITDSADEELPVETEQLIAQPTLAGKLGAAARALWKRPGAAIDIWKLQDEAFKASERLGKFLRGMLVQLP